MPHTADVILEAWGPDFAACCEEAAAALVELYVAPGAAPEVTTRVVHLHAGPAEELLIALLEEVIFTLDTADVVPVGAGVTSSADHGLDVVLQLAERRAVAPTGAVPKAVSRSELKVLPRAHGVRCRFLVDV